MAAREENILNVPISETLEGMHVLCDTGDTGEPYRVAASLFIAEATQAAKDAVSNLDPKDVILKGFTALTAGKPAITANTTLLAAIRSLYAMVGSGKVKIVSDGADQTGMVSWNGTSASGFVINVNEAAIYTRSQWTQSNPDSVTDANWIAAVKTGGTKTPFAAAQNPNMGDLPTNSSLKFVDNKTTILGMLEMLTAAANVGRLRIVSGNPATGASGKPELAFIVNIVQGANAETQGTNGLQIFHLTNDYIRVIPSSSVAMAWPTLQTLTDEAIITKLHSTASGDWGGLGVTMEWAGSGGSAMKYLTVTDFRSNTFSNGAMRDIAVGEMFTFTSAVDAANGPGTALVGYAVRISALSFKYVGTSISINTYNRSYLYTYQSTSLYATKWSILGTPTGIEASVYEFAYEDGANNVPTSDLKLVKVADIFRLVFSTPDQADYSQLDFIRSMDSNKTDQYVFVCPSVDTGAPFGGSLQRIAVDATTGAVGMTGVGLAIEGQAAQRVMVTNFVAPTNAVIRNLSIGQGLIVYASANAPGLPSGVTGTAFYGHCIKNSLINSYTYLLQTADGSRTFSGSTNGTTTTWTELGGGSGGTEQLFVGGSGGTEQLFVGGSGGTEQLFVGDIALANAAPETFNLGGEVHDGDLLMIVYDFISSDHTMVGPKAGRSIIWTATSGTYDITVEAFDYSSATGGVSRISGFNLMLSASGTILSMEATGEVDTIIEAFHVVGIYRLSKAL